MADSIILKTCRVCKTPQPITNFWKRTQSKDGLQPLCKKCNADETRCRTAKKLPPRDPEILGEIWRPVFGLEEEYSVSNLGNVRREKRGPRTYPGRLLNPSLHHTGYYVVVLRKPQQLFVHRLVAQAFLEPEKRHMDVNHKNSVTTDNRVENLEFVTHAENLAHSARVGRQALKLTPEIVREIRAEGTKGVAHGILAAKYGVAQSNISRIISRQRWVHLD